MMPIIYLVITTLLFLLIHNREYTYGQVSNQEDGQKYKYTLVFYLADEQEYQCNLYCNLLHENATSLLKAAGISKSLKKKIVFTQDGTVFEVRKKDIVCVELQREEISTGQHIRYLEFSRIKEKFRKKEKSSEPSSNLHIDF